MLCNEALERVVAEGEVVGKPIWREVESSSEPWSNTARVETELTVVQQQIPPKGSRRSGVAAVFTQEVSWPQYCDGRVHRVRDAARGGASRSRRLQQVSRGCESGPCEQNKTWQPGVENGSDEE